MDPFDPYHKWLGIPPKDQPPNHYRLLGLELFESDADAIDAAADQRAYFVRQCASGRHVAASQRLLNEIAAARLCLLSVGAKAAYDARQREQLSPALQMAASVPESPAMQRVAGLAPRSKPFVACLAAVTMAVAGFLAYYFVIPQLVVRRPNSADAIAIGEPSQSEPPPANTRPRIAFVPIPLQTIAFDETFSIQLNVATFGAVERILFRLGDRPPPGLNLNPHNGLVSWPPDASRQPGEYRASIYAESPQRGVEGDRLDLRMIVVSAGANVPVDPVSQVSSTMSPSSAALASVSPGSPPVADTVAPAQTPPKPAAVMVRGRSVAGWIDELKASYRADYDPHKDSVVLQRSRHAGTALVLAGRTDPNCVADLLSEIQERPLEFRVRMSSQLKPAESEQYLAADVTAGEPGNLPWKGVFARGGISSKQNYDDYRLYSQDLRWNSTALFLIILQDAGPPAIPPLLDCVGDADSRTKAIRALALMPPADVIPHFCEFCDDVNADVREAGAWGLGAAAGYPRQPPEETLRALEGILGRLLGDSEPRVAEAALRALICLRTEQSAALVVPRTLARLEGNAEAALTVLAALGEHARVAGPALSAAVQSGKLTTLHGEAAWLARKVGPTLAPALLTLAQQGDRDAFQALSAFGSNTPDQVLDALVKALSDPTRFNRAYAMLRELGQSARPVLPQLEKLAEQNGTSTTRKRSLKLLIIAIKQPAQAAPP